MENKTGIKSVLGSRFSVIGYWSTNTENRTPKTGNVFLMLILCFVFSVNGCGRKNIGRESGERFEKAVKSEVEEVGTEEIGIDHKVQHFKLEGFSKEGEDQWYIEGEFAKVVGRDIILNKIKGETFGKDVRVVLIADKGIYNRDTGATELIGGVVVTTSDGGKLSMDYAQWNRQKEEVRTDSHIKIVHNGIELEGEGALVLPKDKWAMLEREIKMKDTSNRVITCDGPLEVDYKKREAIFNNNVEIQDKDGKMYANKVIAHFDAEKREIEKIEWIGDVRAVY